jgi:methylenetetrahydrofolate--tRNA-(uracil-5-)-methyltransferase
VGLIDPRTGRRPWACVQLRRENAAGTLYNLVGFQTHLRWGDQERLLRTIPALEHAEFVRFGSLHRNTYVNAPAHLEGGNRLKSDGRVFLAGQITGVEGYTESAASGLLAGINAVRTQQGLEPAVPPRSSMLGSLVHYLTASDPRHFQPVNAMWGLVEPLEGPAPDGGPAAPGSKARTHKYQRFLAYRARGIRDFAAWAGALGIELGDVSGLDAQAEEAAREAELRKAATA